MLSLDLDHSVEAIEIWLQTELSNLLHADFNEIDTSRSIYDFGLDSVTVIRLLGKLGEIFDIEISASLTYEYEDLHSLAEQISHLANKKLTNTSASISIVITASFTIENIAESLKYWLEKVSFNSTISFAPYNQIFQQLLDPKSLVLTNKQGVNVLFFRLEDFFRYQSNTLDKEISKIKATIKDFLAALESATRQTKAKFILALCPHSKEYIKKLDLADKIEGLDEEIIKEAKNFNNLSLLDLRNISFVYKISEIFDPMADQLGHIPFTKNFFTLAGILLSRKIFTLYQMPYKVIALDCDNTLWQGVCAEDGALGVKITNQHIALQKFILSQQKAGKLLVLVSKNIASDVWAVFENNPNMILKKEHIVSSRINWKAKSQNLKDLAEELNLATDSFIFIDDNPIECIEVTTNLPTTLVVELPENNICWESFFNNHWAFDIEKITSEDAKRTEMYLQNKQRQELKNQAGNFEKFLAELELNIEISPLEINDLDILARAAQLTQRTNQFNATTIRRSEAELAQLIDSKNYKCLTVKVNDRFGDYGFVGLMIAELREEKFFVETFLLSCRVLGRQVEHKMIEYLANLANSLSCQSITLVYQPTERNKPIKDFYQSFKPLRKEQEKYLIDLDIKEIGLLLKTIKSSELTDSENLEKAANQKSLVINSLANSKALQEIALYGQDIDKILAVTYAKKSPRPNLKNPFVSPKTNLQKQIAEIWCNIFSLDRVGIYDDFYQLGGDSLQSAELVARLTELGLSNTISLSIMEQPTVAGLAQAIEDIKAGKNPTLVTALSSLDEEAKLNFTIDTKFLEKRIFPKPEKIFFTGASGYVGAFLIYELLKQSSVEIFCHVRASSQTKGFQRVKENLSRYQLWEEGFENRIKIILGDLSKPSLGMSSTDFNFVASQIDAIFHNGAWVNFILPYTMLKAANVIATEEILKLSIDQKLKPLHFVSTLGVLMSGYDRDQILFEDQELDHSEELPNGYEQSKWVADKMVYLAMKKGLPINIYRLGMMSGLSNNGVYHKLNEFLPSFFKGCIQLGSFPTIDGKLEMVPVDFVSKALIAITKDNNFGKVYHMNHPKALTVLEIIDWIKNFGYPLRAIDWGSWKQELLNSGSARLRENGLYPFLDFIKALESHQTYMPEMDLSNFNQAVANNNLSCPLQTELLEKYFKYFIEVNYLPPPN